MVMKKLLFIFSFFISFCSFGSIELPLVVIIASYNNDELFQGKKRLQHNLSSVFDQQYENYRVIYVDDCSTDGTANEVERYIKACGQEHRVTFIRNDHRWGPSRNRFIAGHLCKDVCPYTAPQFVDVEAEKTRMQKCNYCVDRVDVGKQPVCVEACYARAIDSGTLGALKAK